MEWYLRRLGSWPFSLLIEVGEDLVVCNKWSATIGLVRWLEASSGRKVVRLTGDRLLELMRCVMRKKWPVKRTLLYLHLPALLPSMRSAMKAEKVVTSAALWIRTSSLNIPVKREVRVTDSGRPLVFVYISVYNARQVTKWKISSSTGDSA